jgi:hypothetical protein
MRREAADRKRWFRLTDAFFIAGLIMIAIVWIAVRGNSNKNDADTKYIIYVDGAEAETGVLLSNGAVSGQKTFSVDSRPGIVFSIKDGAISIIESDCPDRVCVKTGYIQNNGQTAACIPNNTVIRVIGGGADAYVSSDGVDSCGK